MPRRTRLLYALQQIDAQLAVKRRRYQQIEASLGESAALSQARVALQEAEDELKRCRATLLDSELQAQSAAEKLKTDTARLYSGQVTNPRALSDLEKETEYLKRLKSQLEDRQLEAMMAVERATHRFAVANEAYIVAEAAWTTENAGLNDEYGTLKQDLAQLLAQRQSVARHISADDMAEYDTIRRLRKGVAVVAVRGGMCKACNVEVPQRDLEKAQQTDDLFHCSGCERILYVPQDGEAKGSLA